MQYNRSNHLKRLHLMEYTKKQDIYQVQTGDV